MMKIIKVDAVAVIGIVGLICAAAFVEVGMCQTDNEEAANAPSTAATPVTPVIVNNTICPVTEKVVFWANPVTVEYKGKIYNLYSKDCIAVFNSDPQKYIEKIPREVKKKPINYFKFGNVPPMEAGK